jgi:hypothetical protein
MIQATRMMFVDLPVERACALLDLDRSGYYREPQNRPVHDANETALRDAVENVAAEFAGYGYRRVTAQLMREGWQVNHKRVLRIMREESLLCQIKRRWVPTTDSQHGLRIYPNLLPDAKVARLNQAWVADLTYIRLPSGFCYLAALLDAFSRRCGVAPVPLRGRRLGACRAG